MGAIPGAFAGLAATAVLPVHTPAGGALAALLGACGGIMAAAGVPHRVRALPVTPSRELAQLAAIWKVTHAGLAEDTRRPAA